MLKTTNPAILLLRKRPEENIFYGRKIFRKTARLFHSSTRKIFKQASQDQRMQKYASTVAKTFFLSQKPAVVNSTFQKSISQKTFFVKENKETSWIKFLEIGLPKKNIELINWKPNNCQQKKHKNPKINLLCLRNWEYFFVKWFSVLLPQWIWKGQFLVMRESDLVKETAVKLFKNRYKIVEIKVPTINFDKKRRAFISDKIIDWAKKTYFLTTKNKKTSKALTKYFQHQAKIEVAKQDAFESKWHDVISSYKNLPVLGILANYPHGTEMYALREICKTKGIPIYGFQHGVGREICTDHHSLSFFYENNAADIVFLYNKKSKLVSEKFRLISSKCFVSGAPKIRKALNPFSKKYPFMYVSTMLYHEGSNITLGNADDLDKAKFEIQLIREVFGYSPHSFFYKPYPAERYGGFDPVLQEAAKYSNIYVYQGSKVFQDLYSKSEILITSRATSTLGDCFSTNMPIIYLDINNQQGLSKESKERIKTACLYIDCSKKNWIFDLKSLLHKPLKKILQKVKKNKEQRKKFENLYITEKSSQSAGHIAANIIKDITFPVRR